MEGSSVSETQLPTPPLYYLPLTFSYVEGIPAILSSTVFLLLSSTSIGGWFSKVYSLYGFMKAINVLQTLHFIHPMVSKLKLINQAVC